MVEFSMSFEYVKRVNMGREGKKEAEDLGPHSRNNCRGSASSTLL